MRPAHRVDRWFWRTFGMRGTVMINIGAMLILATFVAARVLELVG